MLTNSGISVAGPLPITHGHMEKLVGSKAGCELQVSTALWVMAIVDSNLKVNVKELFSFPC